MASIFLRRPFPSLLPRRVYYPRNTCVSITRLHLQKFSLNHPKLSEEAGKLSPSLVPLLAKLPKLPHVAATDPERSVLDLFKVAIAQAIVDGIPTLTVEQVYDGVDFGKKGNDFTVALPRFKLKGKPDAFAKQVLEKVRG